MKFSVPYDKIGICSSFICMIHCMAIPIALIFGLESILAFVDQEWIELLLLGISLVVGGISFAVGFIRHRQHYIPIVFVAGFLLLAIENSLAGSILPNYSLLRNEAVEVVGEVGLRVKLNVMALPGTNEEDIKEVHSHQMAIRQCGNFFDQYPQIKVVEAFDTAGSAKAIRDHKLINVAAIAGKLAAKEYGLDIIKESIEDHDLNYTRFLVLQKKGGEQIADPNKVSVYFQTKNDPGSLAHALTIISGLGINLGKLQSHPVPSKNSLYGFYATLEIDDLSQLNDLELIMNRMALTFEILGIYKRGQTHG